MTAPLVRASTFIKATRETGYRNTAFALAELIDNSIQANATTVDILLQADATSESGAGIRIVVADNGRGMTPEELTRAMQFGGSSRFDDRGGQGRFGMGLPNASLSQAKRIDVISWVEGSASATSLDVDSIANGIVDGIPAAMPCDVPRLASVQAPTSGTIVVWRECDRVPYKRPGMLARHLRRELGRMFRRFLDNGLRLTLNGQAVSKLDPTLVVPSPTKHPIELLPTLVFPFATPLAPGGVSDVRVTFTVLPVRAWAPLSNEIKRAHGITATPTVSLLRANREIASGWFLMGDKRKENYDDWWRCDIEFEPYLDEWFGVSHSKQGVRPTNELSDVLCPTLERQARELNRRVRNDFEALRSSMAEPTSVAEQLHRRIDLSPDIQRGRPIHSRPARTVLPRYALEVAPMEARSFVAVKQQRNQITLSLNANHPFFSRVYSPCRRAGRDTVRSLELWLLGLARVLGENATDDKPAWDRLLEQWSDAAALLLEEGR